MKNRLEILYALQQIDSGLDELHEFKGNLPAIVNELSEKLESKKSELSNLEQNIKKFKLRVVEIDGEASDLSKKIEKYKQQQYQIKTNKQYDSLTHEIETSEEKIKSLKKELIETEGKSENAKKDSETLSPEIKTIEEELNERKEELREVSSEHEEEENKLKHKREKIAVKVQKSDLRLYERIRKAKDGKAVVPITRNSCGGCFHRVPPQLVLELRKNHTMNICEHCGRILVSDEIVEDSNKLI